MSQVTADGGCERDVVFRMNDGYRAWGALKSVLSKSELRIKAKKCLYEGGIVITELYRSMGYNACRGMSMHCSWICMEQCMEQ